MAAAAAIGLALVLTWPLAAHLGRALPGDLADPLLNAFSLAWDASRAPHAMRGVWDAPFFFPRHDALAFSDHLLGVAVFTAPVQWLTGNAVLAYDLAFIASYALAGFSAFLLARSLWRSSAAGWVAGAAFAAAPCRAMHVSHLQMLTGGWLALALWGLHGYFTTRSRRSLAVFAGSYALLALSSSYLLYFGAIPVAAAIGAGLWYLLHSASERPRLPRVAAELVSAGLLVALVLAPVAAAYLRVREATGLRRTVSEMAMFSARWTDYVTIPPGLQAWSAMLTPGAPERMLFPGLLVALLAAAAPVIEAGRGRHLSERNDAVWLCAAVLCLSAWLALGPAAGAYRLLMMAVPGLDGLRVPARFVVVASLPLALLAGRGAQLLGGRGAGAVSLVSALVIAAEGLAAPVPLATFDAQQRDRVALNSWLRRAPAGGVLELPIAGPQFQPFTTAYQFNTLFHLHPIVNGYSGTGYALQDFLGQPGSPIARVVELPAALRGLRAIGVRYVVLHRAEFERWNGWNPQPLVDAMDAESQQLQARAQFGDDIAWKLADAPAFREPSRAGARLLAARDFSVSASRSEGVSLAVDGRTDTGWTTGAPQQGDEWFEATFDRETDVAAVAFRTDRSGHSERPRHLVIESVGGDGVVRTVFDDSLVPAIIGAAAGANEGAVIGLPANRSRVLRLRQTGRGGRTPWSIQELQLYARGE